jgi:hypothetical protein
VDISIGENHKTSLHVEIQSKVFIYEVAKENILLLAQVVVSEKTEKKSHIRKLGIHLNDHLQMPEFLAKKLIDIR